jgi:hypothetical protein
MEQTYDKNLNLPISREQRQIEIAECKSYHVSDNKPVQIIGRYGRSSSSILIVEATLSHLLITSIIYNPFMCKIKAQILIKSHCHNLIRSACLTVAKVQNWG